LEKEKVLEDQEMEKLMAELNETQNSLEAAQSRLDSVSEKLPALEARTVEAEEREREAIRISNEKDPQVEELGKWYEMR
jgi:seryl-tRNA synthetase